MTESRTTRPSAVDTFMEMCRFFESNVLSLGRMCCHSRSRIYGNVLIAVSFEGLCLCSDIYVYDMF